MIDWLADDGATGQLQRLCVAAAEPGLLAVRFPAGEGGALPWSGVEPWTRSRAVTIADVVGDLGGAALEVALCCDLVFVRRGVSLDLGRRAEPASAAITWALARAGQRAALRGLLFAGTVTGSEAVDLGLAQARLDTDAPLPLPERVSLAAVTAARDLGRSRATGSAAGALELATFRLLFATGDPGEGARAFLERRQPRFEDG